MQQCGHLLQAAKNFVDGLLLPRKVQANQVVDRFPEEAGAGNRGNPDLPDHPLTELQIRPALKLRQRQEVRDLHHHKVGPLRDIVLQPQAIQSCQEVVPFLPIQGVEVPVVFLSEAKSRDGGLLQRRRCAHGKEVMNLSRRFHDFFRPE